MIGMTGMIGMIGSTCAGSTMPKLKALAAAVSGVTLKLGKGVGQGRQHGG